MPQSQKPDSSLNGPEVSNDVPDNEPEARTGEVRQVSPGDLELRQVSPGDLELRQVSPGDLDLRLGRLRNLPESSVKAMEQSLARHGQLTPLLASELDGALLLVDGFVRRQAAVRLNWDRVQLEVQHLSAAQMKVQLYLRNRERGLTLLEECRLLRELNEVDGLSQTELGDLLLRHKSWVSRRLTLVRQLSPTLLMDGSLCDLSGGCLSSLAQLQTCNQERLWAVCQQHRLKPAEATQLIVLYRKAPDEEARGYVLASPKEALALRKRKAESAEDARLGRLGNELFRLLRLLGQVSVRVQNRRFAGIELTTHAGRQVLRQTVVETRQQSNKALSMVDELLSKQGEQA